MTTDAPNETFGNTAADAFSPAGHARDAAVEQDFDSSMVTGSTSGRALAAHALDLLGAMHGRRSSDHPIGFEFGDLLIGQAETGQYLVVVYAEQTCRAGVDPGSPAGGRERQRAVPGPLIGVGVETREDRRLLPTTGPR
jgi:hypothetical protein